MHTSRIQIADCTECSQMAGNLILLKVLDQIADCRLQIADMQVAERANIFLCSFLLYPSDAADEEDSVVIWGRRDIHTTFIQQQ